MKRLLLIITLSLCLGNFLTTPVYAAEISSQQAAQIATSRYPGRVIDVKSSGSDYRVKVLDQNGGMHIVVIDRQTGNIKSAN